MLTTTLLLAALAAAPAQTALAAAPAQTALAGNTELTFYGQSAFIVKTPKGTVIAIDPWLSNPKAKDKDAAAKVTKLDYILITHGHSDHVGDAIELAKRTKATLVTMLELSQVLVEAGYPAEQATETSGNFGGTFQLGEDAKVTFVSALHTSSFKKDATSPLQYAGNPAGFVIEIAGGPTIYHTGDTDVTSDMQLIFQRWNVDLMLACIGGHYTMGPLGAAMAVTMVKPKQVIPMHYGTFPALAGTPAELIRELVARKSPAKVIEMAIGETKTFSAVGALEKKK